MNFPKLVNEDNPHARCAFKSWVEAWRDISPVAALPCSGVLARCLPSALHTTKRGECARIGSSTRWELAWCLPALFSATGKFIYEDWTKES